MGKIGRFSYKDFYLGRVELCQSTLMVMDLLDLCLLCHVLPRSQEDAAATDC